MNPLVKRPAFENLFDDMLKGFFVRPVGLAAEGGLSPDIKLDVREDDKAYTVEAELPGVKKEDIHVEIDGNTVSISAEVRQEKESREGEKVLRSERYFGSTSRRFQLAHEIDDQAANARFVDGVLTLTLPKRAPGRGSKLLIE
ncbi:heat shock protein Hsp20 [Crenobacter luteus]|uniref:Heat-shock protein Hsp20 n=1 Tax=Crenobacter luteus TaxID=1452487 RepID=A0A161SBS9_9NEIS|nr:Hsp20/alpha crystallin family protein [Crenobacter luteus]KZE33503.1 heat-shock protein Hsp20 [Crenobacter luteus]TCP13065.1 heat shock protein Hsp20 [Crenobacter luteus]